MSSRRLGMEREGGLDAVTEDMSPTGVDSSSGNLPECSSSDDMVMWMAASDADFEDLPPGRMNATRSTASIRLMGSKSNFSNTNTNAVHHHAMSLPNFSVTAASSSAANQSASGDSSSVSSQGSGYSQGRRKPGNVLEYPHSPRSKSPSLRAGTAATADGNSSISSLDDVDSDILYDRAGFIDSDVLSTSSSDKRKNRSISNLPSLNERLSEDTLEDVHAFSDVKVTSPSLQHNSSSDRSPGGVGGGGGGSSASRANSVCTADMDKLQLDPLMEEGDEDAESLDDPSESTDTGMPPVILTNIENLSLHHDTMDDDFHRSGNYAVAGDVTANSSTQNAAGDTTSEQL